MRISIVGLPGSGKTTLAVTISEKFAIPHIHLDRFWFEAGGRQGRHTTPNLETVRSKVKERAQEAMSADSWVSDGTHLHVQSDIVQKAELLIFLDLPLVIRLLNHAHRAFFEPQKHGELSLWDELLFFFEIVKRERTSKPKLLAFLNEHKDKVHRLRSRKQVKAFLDELAKV